MKASRGYRFYSFDDSLSISFKVSLRVQFLLIFMARRRKTELRCQILHEKRHFIEYANLFGNTVMRAKSLTSFVVSNSCTYIFNHYTLIDYVFEQFL